MKSTIQDKAKLVNSVFSEVYNKYDLMKYITHFMQTVLQALSIQKDYSKNVDIRVM